jgi:hypothetical protein
MNRTKKGKTTARLPNNVNEQCLLASLQTLERVRRRRSSLLAESLELSNVTGGRTLLRRSPACFRLSYLDISLPTAYPAMSATSTAPLSPRTPPPPSPNKQSLPLPSLASFLASDFAPVRRQHSSGRRSSSLLIDGMRRHGIQRVTLCARWVRQRVGRRSRRVCC